MNQLAHLVKISHCWLSEAKYFILQILAQVLEVLSNLARKVLADEADEADEAGDQTFLLWGFQKSKAYWDWELFYPFFVNLAAARAAS